jgi:chorismate mutase/prephenate dehydratase
MDLETQLKGIRDQIDAIDSDWLRLINKRIELAKQVGEIKHAFSVENPRTDSRQAGVVIYKPEREAQVIRRLIEENTGEISNQQINVLSREIMSICRGAEARMQVAVLGPEGTFTEMAALQQFGSSVDIVPKSQLDQVFNAVETTDVNYGVVPVENSTEGIVSTTADLLVSTPLFIAGEIYLPIHQALLGVNEDYSKIKKIYSHAQSLSQCRLWLLEHLPNVDIEAVSSNAEAARRASEEVDCGAIAGENAALQYGLDVLANHIEDYKNNTTRFLVLSREEVTSSGRDKTSLLMSCRNQPGSLFKLLQPMHDHGISMLKIESRPSKIKRWEYLFFVDIEGHRQDENIKRALTEVEAAAGYFRVLGAYPCAD